MIILMADSGNKAEGKYDCQQVLKRLTLKLIFAKELEVWSWFMEKRTCLKKKTVHDIFLDSYKAWKKKVDSQTWWGADERS